jgi:hypothetical protein
VDDKPRRRHLTNKTPDAGLWAPSTRDINPCVCRLASRAAPPPQRSNPLDWLVITFVGASGVLLYKLQRRHRAAWRASACISVRCAARAGGEARASFQHTQQHHDA